MVALETGAEVGAAVTSSKALTRPHPTRSLSDTRSDVDCSFRRALTTVEGRLTPYLGSSLEPDAFMLGSTLRASARASATANVSIRPGSLASVEVDPAATKVGKERTRQFIAIGSDKHGNKIPDLAFLWESLGGAMGQDGVLIANADSGSYRVDVSATFEGSTVTGFAMVEVLEGFPQPSWVTKLQIPTRRGAMVAETLSDGIHLVGGRYLYSTIVLWFWTEWTHEL